MRIKTKLRECEEYRSVFLEMDLSREERERGKEVKNTEAEEREATGLNSMVTEKRSLAVCGIM